MKVRQCYADTLAAAGLLPNQHAILSTLHEAGPCNQKELALRVVVNPADIVAYLDGLQDREFVIRKRDPADRRRQIVSITDAGLEKLIDADRELDGVETAVFGDLSARDLASLNRIAARVYDSANAANSAR